MLIEGLEFVGATIGLVFLIGWFWCVNDAFEHTDAPWIWLVILTLFLPVAVPTYMVMRSYAFRGPNAAARAQMEREDSLIPKFRFANEIERAKYIEAAAKGHGTMYEPEAGLGVRIEGYPHFTDQKAEALIEAQRFEEAWAYLIDVYDLAQKESDPQRMDTYRHYISRLPEGTERLRELQAAAQRDPDRPQERSSSERSLPF